MIGPVFGNVHEPLEFSGWAGDYDRSIKGVQFSLDCGEHWTTYETPDTTSERNVFWRFVYTPENPGYYVLSIRSINELGEKGTQPATVEFWVN